jgi:hypothetical protein
MGATLVFDIIRGLALLVGLTAGAKSKISDIVFTTWLGLGMFLFMTMENISSGYSILGGMPFASLLRQPNVGYILRP